MEESIENKIIQNLIEIKEQMATKDELQVLREEMIHRFDEQTVILQRLDQERLADHQRISRLEENSGIQKTAS